MRSLAVWLLVACTFVGVTAEPAIAQNRVTRAQVDALLGAYEGVDPAQWRGLGAAAIPILESIATDQGALPTRRARSLEGLAALGSGEATMRALANFTAAPLIVRMSAVRGLGQVLPEAALIDALRPLLQDAQWQLRGVAAETLSATPGGCTVIADMARRETDAWRSRFVRRCGEPTGSTTSATEPAAATASDPEVIVARITDPSATKIYDHSISNNIAKLQLPIVLGSVATLLPNSPTIPWTSGSWTFNLLASTSTSVDVLAMIKTPSSAALTSGTLDANLFFVGVPGLTAASAPLDANFQTVLSNVNSIYAQIGVQLGNLTYIDITGADATAYTDLTEADLGALMKLSANPQAADGAINLFFVHSIGGDFSLLGQSAGLPGVPVRGSSASGVAVTMANFPNGLADTASTIAHETGHWLGLFHTTELAGTAFDPLPDTPQCPKVPNDTNNDGIMAPSECLALDGTNVMFWAAQPGVAQTVLTPDQQFVFMRNPLVNVTGTQVAAVPFGSVDVPSIQLSNPVTVNVPADGLSLTFAAVVLHRQRRYVNATAVGAKNGTSWTDAYTDLASALAAETADTEFWVAHGIYKPTAAAGRSAAFTVKPHMNVYGGFAGTETQLSQRDAAANPTVLSGDIDNNDTGTNGVDADTSKIVGNNSYHVVVLDGTTGPISFNTILDGFTITGGKADSVTPPDDRGGGVLCNTSCSATLSNLHFSGNYAEYVGGALYDEGASSPTISNTTFSGNAAANGGAVYQYLGAGSAPVYANVTFAGNSVSSYGGAMYNYQTTGSASLAMTNVTFSGNLAEDGGGGAAMAHYNCGATLTSALTNMIIWGNSPDQIIFVCDTPTFNNSVLQGSGGSGVAWNSSFGIDGGGNLATDPFLGPLQNNGGSTPTLLPGPGSSAVDAGLDSACTAWPVNGHDQRGIVRPIGAHCDSGAVESTLPAVDIANVKIAFAVAGLPSFITLCRNPALIAAPYTTDSSWVAKIDIDNNSSSGFQGYDTYVRVYTTPQAAGCSTHTAATASSLFGTVVTVDVQGIETYAGTATISVDTASGRIIAAIPANNVALKGLSASSRMIFGASAMYADGVGARTYAEDDSDVFAVNTASSDPLHDVTQCSGACNTGVEWYPQTDLVGGALLRADRVFTSGFQ